jgi:glycerophosphoryl diester phosphodiesterase
MNTGPVVIAHRGASRAQVENTVAAFRRARELGAEWVELDVRIARDGALVVHHDARYADGRAVCDVDSRDRPSSVPQLDDALDACAGMGVNAEIKNSPGEPGHDPDARVVDALVDVVRRRASNPPLLVSSFDEPTLRRLRALDPQCDTALLTFELPDDRVDALVARVVAAGHRALHPFDRTVDAALVDAAHRVGLSVNVWTVDDPARIAELAALGVDGICTNVPDVARSVLDRATGSRDR